MLDTHQDAVECNRERTNQQQSVIAHLLEAISIANSTIRLQ